LHRLIEPLPAFIVAGINAAVVTGRALAEISDDRRNRS
jgi:hypothetical protein